MVPAAFQQIGKPHQIALDIGLRIDQAVAHPGLGGQVDHMGGFIVDEQFVEQNRVGQIAPHPMKSRARR